MTTIIQKAVTTSQKLILDVRAPTNATSLTGVMLFGTQDSTQELAVYAANYSAATGIYTVPAGGHKNVRVRAVTKTSTAGATMTGLDIQLNGVVRASAINSTSAATIVHVVEANFRNLVAGDLIKVVGNGGNTAMSTNTNGDMMQIFADA